MKKLSHVHLLTGICAAGGVLAAALRFWLMMTGVDDKGLFVTGHAGSILSWVVTAVLTLAAALVLLCTKQAVSFPEPTQPAYGAAAASIGFFSCIVWLFGVKKHTFTFLAILCGVVACVCSLAMALSLRNRKQPKLALRLPGIVFFIALLLHVYQQWSSESQLQAYGFQLLALLCMMLSFYGQAALANGGSSHKSYVFFSRMSIFLSLAAMPGSGCAVFYLAMAMSLVMDGCRSTLPQGD